MTKFEEEFNYLIELSGKVLIGQVDAEAFEKNRIAFFEKYETDQQQALPKTVEDFQGELEDLIDDILDDYISDLPFDGKKYKFIEKYAPQALPVVPECVGEWIEHCKGMGYGLIAALTFKLSSTMHEELSAKILKWLDNEGNDETFALAFITGKYEVEKPQLFYLENKLTGMYLYKKALRGYGEEPSSSIKYLTDDFKFTQQEIGSMETGSYEQIKVEVEK